MKRIAAAFLLFFLLGGALQAEPELQLNLQTTTRVVLPNGLKVLVRQRSDTDDVAVYLMVGAGQLTEDESHAGITNELQNYLMDVHVEGYHDAASAIEAQGGVASADSGPDTSNFSMQLRPKSLPLALSILSDLMSQKQMDPARFDEIKKNTLAEIKNSENESFQALYGIFLQEFYTFHPYRVPVTGMLSSVMTMDEEDLLKYYQAYYHPNNMVLAIVGNVDTEHALSLVNRYFSRLKSKTIQSQSIYYQPILDDNKTIQLGDNGSIAWLFMGFSAPELKSDDYESMQLINSVLGSSIGSRLWVSIRENRGLSYDLGSQYSVREGPSHFIIYVTTSPKNLNASKGELLKQVNEMRNSPMSDDELAIAKRRLIGHFIMGLETNSEQAQFLAWSEITGKGMAFDKTYISEIRAITPQDVQRVARKYLENYILIAVQ